MANTKKSFTERAKAEPTDLHRNFAAWLKEQTGVDVDLKTVQLVCSMRMDFQRSEENQNDLQARKTAAAARKEKAAAAKRASLESRLAKIQAELEATGAGSEAAPAPKRTATKK
ncbi:hypothetical protein ACFUIZ_14900 [Streptomyces cinereoruber]|uniref:hypothetical protein n=1 Tax=Streptomyces cinereoruber TaxID=67260 RepID=UPI003640ABC7